jgi:4-amino-4-deoxychorismate lyase
MLEPSDPVKADVQANAVPHDELEQPTNFQITTSTRYDPTLPNTQSNSYDNEHHANDTFYLLPFHLDRLLLSAKHFNFPTSRLIDSQSRLQFRTWIHSQLLSCNSSPVPAKLRISLDRENNVTLTTTPTTIVTPPDLFPTSLLVTPNGSSRPLWTVFIYPKSVPSSPFTLHKTTYRPMYDTARSILPPPSAGDAEVLIYNTNGEISEGSVTTAYFYRGGRWVTPPLSSGGNAGTTRRWALERKLCVEAVVMVTDLVNGEYCWLSNGVRGFLPGKIQLSKNIQI